MTTIRMNEIKRSIERQAIKRKRVQQIIIIGAEALGIVSVFAVMYFALILISIIGSLFA